MANQDLGGQLELLQQMKQILGELPEMFDRIGSAAGSQTDSLSELAGSMEEATDSGGASDMTGALEEMAGAADDAGGKMSKMGKALGVAGVAIGAATGAAKGFTQGLSASFNAVGSLTSSIFNLAKGAVGALMNAWGGLLSMAQDIAKQGRDLAKDFEAVRGTFGNLASNEGKAVIDMTNSLKSSSGFAAKAGMSLGSVYGTDLNGALKDMAAMAGELGAAFNRMSQDFVDNAAEALILQKGYGLSTEGLAGLRDMAVQSGEDMNTAMNETAQMITGLSKQYGVSGKVIGKNLSELSSNFGQFGHLSRSELAATATYAAKLGVEVSSLNSMFDKFANFEDAATGAAKLAETFGMNVDAMALMNAESPAEQMDMMRSAFMETGRSLEDLSRQEKQYLADQMGLSDANDLAAMFDPANADISYDDMIADAEAATEAISPEEAMLEAAKGIEKSMDRMMDKVEGFIDSFISGFLHATAYLEPFRDMMNLIDEKLHEVWEIGGELANELFGPQGVFGKDSEKSLASMEAFLDQIVGWFRTLKDQIVLLLTPAEEGGITMSQFMENMWDATVGFFQSPAFQNLGSQIIDGLADVMVFVMEGITDMAMGLVEGLTNGFSGAMGDNMFGSAESPINQSLQGLMDKIGPLIEPMMDALGELFGVLIEKAIGWMTDWAMANPLAALGVFTVLFGPAFIGAAVGAIFGAIKAALIAFGPQIVAWLGSTALPAIGSFFTTTLFPFITSSLLPMLSGLGSTILGAIGSFFTSSIVVISAKVIAIGAAIYGAVMAIFQSITRIFDRWGDDSKSIFEKVIGTIIDILTLPYRAVVNVVNLITEYFFGVDILTPFNEGIDAIIEAFGGLAEAVWEWIVRFTGNFDLSKTWENLKTGVVDAFNSVIESVSGAINAVFEYLDPAMWLQKALDAGSALLEGVTGPIMNMGENIGAAASDAWDSFTGFFGISSPSKLFEEGGQSMVDGMMGSVSAIPEEMMEQMKKVADGIKKVIGVMIDIWLFLPTKIFEFITMIVDKFIEFAPMILQIVDDAFNSMMEMISTSIDTIIDVVMFLPTKFVEMISMITESIFGIDIASPFKDGIEGIKGFIQDGIDFIMGIFSPTALGQIASDALDGFMSMFSIVNAIELVFGDVPYAVKKILGIASPSTVFAEMGGHVTDGFSGSVEEMPAKMEEMMGVLIDKAIGAFNNMTALIMDFVYGYIDLVMMMPNAFIDGIQYILDAIIEFAPMVSGYLGDMITNMTDILQTGVSFLLDIFMFMPTKMIEAVSSITDALFGIDIATPFKEGFAAVKDTIMDAITFFMETFSPAAMAQAAVDIVAGFVQGFNLSDAIAEKAEAAWDSFTGFFGIASPSALMAEAGGNISDGFAAGTEGMDQALVGNTDKATALLAEVDKVSSSLNGMDAIEAESTVSKVAAGLSGDGTVTVQHEGLNIQVNFKVNIDSKDLAAALGDDADGGPFFVINTSRGGADAGGAEAAGE